MKKLNTRQRKLGPPVRRVKEKELGPFGELSTSNPGSEVPGARPEALNVSAQETDDVDMGDEVAQWSVSDAESAWGEKVREPRRRNNPLDRTFREIEDHVLTGSCKFSIVVRSLCPRARSSRETPGSCRKELEDGSNLQVVSWDYCFLGARNRISESEVEQRGDSPVLVMHDGVTKSIFAHL